LEIDLCQSDRLMSMAHKHLNAKLQLEAARAQGRIFFRRVTGPLFAGAASLMLLGVTLEALLAVACEGSLGLSKVDCKYARSMPSVLMMLAAPLVMLIVLPTQNRFIWLLNAIQTPGGFVVSLYFGFEIRGALAKQRFAQGECVSFDLDEPTPCECLMSTLVVLSTFALVCVNTSAAFVALLLRRGLSSRRRLDGIWRIMRTAYVTAGSVSLIALVAELVRGHCSETDVFRRVLLWGQTLIALLIGALLSMPNVRARTHAFLSVRSEAAAAASGIASVLSGRPIDELASNAARLFRAIRLDLVRYEDLVDATIDPKLESRAQPRDLLDCDAFISHSWSDPPAEKWIALQLWRRQFIADHGREPVVFIGAPRPAPRTGGRARLTARGAFTGGRARTARGARTATAAAHRPARARPYAYAPINRAPPAHACRLRRQVLHLTARRVDCGRCARVPAAVDRRLPAVRRALRWQLPVEDVVPDGAGQSRPRTLAKLPHPPIPHPITHPTTNPHTLLGDAHATRLPPKTHHRLAPRSTRISRWEARSSTSSSCASATGRASPRAPSTSPRRSAATPPTLK
jgi:hypothetical protein